MYNLSFEKKYKFATYYEDVLKNLKPEPILFFPYIKRVLRERFNYLQPQYPMEIKIPKEIKYLLKGDFEPAKIIKLEKPLMFEDVPIWFETTENETFLRFGYKNLDARFISDISLNMELIHGFLGGSSGHGKSVAINSMLAATFFEYPPWEWIVHLSDAKIIEFKKYGVKHHIPHVRTIAATEDADFILSVLQNAFDEMNLRGKIFGAIGVSNLRSFREKTGLTLPRVGIIMDEVESTFKLAGRKSLQIANLIDGFARLGRATGFHIIMATQNLTSDIPSTAMGQVKLRMCLGANAATSEKVLGNDGASENMGRIGRMILNTEVLNGGKTSKYNIKFQTPFLTDDNFEFEMKFLEDKGNEVGFKQTLSFYDEEDLKLINTMLYIIDTIQEKIRKRNDLTYEEDNIIIYQYPIILGYPAFVTNDIDGMLKIFITLQDIDNIIIISPIGSNIGILLKILCQNLCKFFEFANFFSDFKFKKMFPTNSLLNKEVHNTEAQDYNMLNFIINKRLFTEAIETVAKKIKLDITTANKYFKEHNLYQYIDNEFMARRYIAFINLPKYQDYKKIVESLQKLIPDFNYYINNFKKFIPTDRWVNKNDYSKLVITLGDLSKITGLGRDFKSKSIDNLKFILQESWKVNVIFILYTSTFEGLNSLQSCINYAIFDKVDTREYGRLRLGEEISDDVKDSLCILGCINDKKAYKFKRSILND